MSRRRRRVLRWVAAGLVAVALVVILSRLRPAAPRSLDLLTGREGSAYYAIGESYARYLAARGVRARVVVTQGALDNLRRLAASRGPTVALAQTGVEHELDDASVTRGLVSLGSLGLEPMWLFARRDAQIGSIADLRGRKVALGPKGSGTRALADLLFEVNDLAGHVESEAFDGYAFEQTLEALRSGALDAGFLVSGPSSPGVRRVQALEDVEIVPFRRAKAYAALYPELARVVIPAGALDLARNQPEEDLELVAGATNLVSRDDLHPAAVELLLDAARNAHRPSSLVAPAGTFPNMDHASLPLSEAAARYYEDGPSGLSRALPYWLAALLDQLVFVVLPALLGLFTVLKAVPAFLNLRFSYHSARLYRRLAAVEKGRGDAAKHASLLDEIAALDRDTTALKPPLSKLAAYFELRQNVHDVRDRLTDPDVG